MTEERSDEDDDVNGLGCGCLLVPGGTAIRRLCKWHETTTFPKTWAGFRAFLDEMYPDDIFPDDGRDLGPSFVVAARRLSKVENDLAGLRGVVQALREPAAIEAATTQVRMILMGTGSVTLAQVDEHAEPLARSVMGAAVRAALAAATARCPECNHEPGCACPDTPTPHGCQTCLAAAADAPQPSKE